MLMPLVIETIIEQTKIRLKLNKDNKNKLSEEVKSKNEEIFKNFINAKTQIDNQTALNY